MLALALPHSFSSASWIVRRLLLPFRAFKLDFKRLRDVVAEGGNAAIPALVERRCCNLGSFCQSQSQT